MRKLSIACFILTVLMGCNEISEPPKPKLTTLQEIQQHAWNIRIDYFKASESEPIDTYTVTVKFDSPENLLGSTTVIVEEPTFELALKEALKEMKKKL